MKKKEMKKFVDDLKKPKLDFKNKLKWEDLSFIDTHCSEDDFVELEKSTLLEFINDAIKMRIQEYYTGTKQGFNISTYEIGSLYAIVLFHPEFKPECPEQQYIPRLEIILSKKPSRTFIELNHYGVDETYDSEFIKEDKEYVCND